MHLNTIVFLCWYQGTTLEKYHIRIATCISTSTIDVSQKTVGYKAFSHISNHKWRYPNNQEYVFFSQTDAPLKIIHLLHSTFVFLFEALAGCQDAY